MLAHPICAIKVRSVTNTAATESWGKKSHDVRFPMYVKAYDA